MKHEGILIKGTPKRYRVCVSPAYEKWWDSRLKAFQKDVGFVSHQSMKNEGILDCWHPQKISGLCLTSLWKMRGFRLKASQKDIGFVSHRLMKKWWDSRLKASQKDIGFVSHQPMKYGGILESKHPRKISGLSFTGLWKMRSFSIFKVSQKDIRCNAYQSMKSEEFRWI